MADFVLTPRQHEANRLLAGPATNIMLFGGSRSGKTFLLVRALISRALSFESRHAVFRFAFSHLYGSIIADTLPKVMTTCYPGVAEHCKLDKTHWVYHLPNGSEIVFGGLDDKTRTEKILGQEFATLYFNECSQIPWASRNMATTRLAQKTGLRLKAYYDCNPPSEAHWTCKLFRNKVDPDKGKPLPRPDDYASLAINPLDNLQNLDPAYLQTLEDLPERMRRRFLLGEFVPAAENALWSLEMLDRGREIGTPPDMRRIVIAVDPSGCSGEEDSRSDEVGIVVCGLGVDGKGYVLEDLSGKFGPAQWGNIIATAFDRHRADAVVAETNFGGAMVQQVIRTARPRTPFREVKASRGKAVRAEPIAALFEQGKACMAGHFTVLEDQCCSMTTAGYGGGRSPDRLDAMVWGLTDIFPGVVKPPRSGPPVYQSATGYSPHQGTYRQ